MRQTATMILALSVAADAAAHTLSGSHSVGEAISHQLFGARHLPVTVFLLVSGLMLLRRLLRGPGHFPDGRQNRR